MELIFKKENIGTGAELSVFALEDEQLQMEFALPYYPSQHVTCWADQFDTHPLVVLFSALKGEGKLTLRQSYVVATEAWEK